MPLTFTDEQYPLFRNSFDARPTVVTVAFEMIDIQALVPTVVTPRSWKFGIEIAKPDRPDAAQKTPAGGRMRCVTGTSSE